MLKKILYNSLLLFLFTIKISAQSNEKKSYDKLILESYEKDQDIRIELDSLLANKDVDNNVLLTLLFKMTKIDSLNQKTILPLLDEYLENKIVLTDNSLAHIYYIIQHADGDVQNKYSNFIEELFQKKIISNQEFAWFDDRLSIRNNKAQKYGFQIKNWAETNENFPYPISHNSEKNCISINLTSSKEYLEKNYSGEYAPQYITNNEFIVFGHINKKDEKLQIIVDNNRQTISNEHGFYVIKLQKNDNNIFTICVKKENIKLDCKTIYINERDWEEIDFKLQTN